MGVLGDAVLGSRPDFRMLPGLENVIKNINGMSFGIGGPARQAKRLYKRFQRGDDVSNMAEFAPVFMNEAKDLSDIEFDAHTGAAQLAAQFGGSEQTNLQNRLIENDKARRRESTGRQIASMIPQMQRDALDVWQQGVGRRDQMNAWKQGALTDVYSRQYDARRQGGILPDLLKGAISGGMKLLGGFRNGLYKVPHDKFPAFLDEGERVLNKPEAEQYNLLEAEGAVRPPQNAPTPTVYNFTAENGAQKVAFQQPSPRATGQRPTPPPGSVDLMQGEEDEGGPVGGRRGDGYGLKDELIDDALSLIPGGRLAPFVYTGARRLAPMIGNMFNRKMPEVGKHVRGEVSYMDRLAEPGPELTPTAGPGVMGLGVTGNDGVLPIRSGGRLPAPVGEDYDVEDGDLLNATRPRRVYQFANEAASAPGLTNLGKPAPVDLFGDESKSQAALGMMGLGNSQDRILQTQPRGTLYDFKPDVDVTDAARSPHPTAAQAQQPFERWHNDSFASGDPVKVESALRDILGPAYEDVAPGPRQRLLTQMLNDSGEPHSGGRGFKDRLIHGLKTAGLAFLVTGNPFLAAGAGVWGGADVNVYHRLKRNAVDLPRLQNEAAIENQQQQQNLNRANQYGNYSGVNSYTGKPTLAARNADSMDAWRRTQDANRDEDRRIREEKQASDVQDRRRKDLIAMDRAGMLTAQQRTELARLSGLSGELQEPYVNGQIAIDWDEAGRPRTINKRTGTVGTVVDPITGKPAGPSLKATQGQQRILDAHAKATLSAYKAGAPLTPQARAVLKAGGMANADQLPDTYDPTRVLYEPETGTITFVGPNTGRVKDKTQTTPRPKKGSALDEFLNPSGGGGQGASQPKQLSKTDVESYAKANQWSYDQALNYLREQKDESGQSKYIVP